MRYDMLHAHTNGTCVGYTLLWWVKMEAKRSIHRSTPKFLTVSHMSIQLLKIYSIILQYCQNFVSKNINHRLQWNNSKHYVNQYNCRKSVSLSTFIAFQSIKPSAIGPKQKPRGAECYCVIVKCPQRGIWTSFSIKTCFGHALWQRAVLVTIHHTWI